jgi:hypothetical protein
VYPTADQTYTYTLLYAQRVVMLAADGDQPLVPENYDDILVWGAVARSALRQNNWLTRDFADQQKLALINKLMASEEMHQRQTADEVETTGIWSSPDPLRDFWS